MIKTKTTTISVSQKLMLSMEINTTTIVITEFNSCGILCEII